MIASAWSSFSIDLEKHKTSFTRYKEVSLDPLLRTFYRQ